MNLPKPEEIIPHRDPFLFLTEVTKLEVPKFAQGYWQLTESEDFFSGHFPDFPTLPGVLMCESIAQLGAYTLLSDSNFEGVQKMLMMIRMLVMSIMIIMIAMMMMLMMMMIVMMMIV